MDDAGPPAGTAAERGEGAAPLPAACHLSTGPPEPLFAPRPLGDPVLMNKKPGRRRMRQNRVLWLLDALERDPRTDEVIEVLGRGVRALPLGRARDVLHGRWLGHPVHPLMVQVPIGTWMSAAVLDLRPGRFREAGLLVGAGQAGLTL